MYTLTETEQSQGEIAVDKLAQVVADIEVEGFAVVENLVSIESRQILLDVIREDALAIKAAGELTPHEKHTGEGHLQLGLPRSAPYVRADLLANAMRRKSSNLVRSAYCYFSAREDSHGD